MRFAVQGPWWGGQSLGKDLLLVEDLDLLLGKGGQEHEGKLDTGAKPGIQTAGLVGMREPVGVFKATLWCLKGFFLNG